MHRHYLTLFMLVLLANCSTTSSVGPQYQSGGEGKKVVLVNTEPFDVSIGVFDAGLEDQTSYGEDGVWPELRRAESMYMAVQLRDVLAKSGTYGAVRITPDLTSSSDLYIKSKIVKSNGEDVAIQVKVIDSTGKTWISKKYSHRVKPITFNNPRNKDSKGALKLDPYGVIYNKIASDIAKYIKRNVKSKKANLINTVTDIRYAQNFSPEAYTDILSLSNNKYKLRGMPDADDPMMIRIKNIQYRDQMFIDNMQTNYDGFASEMSVSYKVWQEQSFAESRAAREAASAAFWQGVAGAVVLAATVAAAGDCDSYACGRNTGIVGGSVAGALFSDSFRSSKAAKIHRDTLNEISASLDGSLSPSVIEMEDRTVTLTGTAEEQSAQWREILRKIYNAEMEQTKPLL